MLALYNQLLEEKGYATDVTQQMAAKKLQILHDELEQFKSERKNRVKRFVFPPELPQGIYLWGDVGCGKSFLMDCFYKALPYRRKKRIHFHAFMQDVHDQIKANAGEADPLVKIASSMARHTRLLCFDEFHVSDIADAMILGRLLDTMFKHGIVLVMTSNYHPDLLWPNGLLRERFLPTIELIKSHLDIVEVGMGVDYRLLALSQVDLYHCPSNTASEQLMLDYFTQSAAQAYKKNGSIEILGKRIKSRCQAHEIIWFDFSALCEVPLSQNDYLGIARQYHTVLLSNIPRLSPEQASAARRFTWLVDVLYEAKVKLIISAACAPTELYVAGSQSEEFNRTVSRLNEMGSQAYLALPHSVLAIKSAVEPSAPAIIEIDNS